MDSGEVFELVQADFEAARDLWTSTVAEMDAELGAYRSTRISRRFRSRVADAKIAFGIFGKAGTKRDFFSYLAAEMWDLFLIDLDIYEKRLEILKKELNSLWFDFAISARDTHDLEELEDNVEFELLISKQFRSHWGRRLYNWNQASAGRRESSPARHVSTGPIGTALE